MVVYMVYDDKESGDQGRFFRNLAEAKSEFKNVESGYLSKITIVTPITKEVIISILNQEGYAINQEEIARKW